MRKVFALALAATMVFTNSILAGDTLVRDAIQSEGYVAGSTGWSINRDGTAEFNDVTSRGEVIVGDETTKYISIKNDPQPIIKLGTPSNAEETLPASIDELATSFSSFLFLSSPERNNSGDDASISLIHNDTPLTQIALNSDENYNTADTTYIGDAALGAELVIERDGNNDYVVKNNDEVWNDVPLVNSWVDVAGGRADYFKDATGRVQIRGQVVSGSAALIGTLPAGYRPTQSMEWIMRGVGGVVMCAVSVSTTGAMTVTANLGTAQGSGIKLDAISFPTF